METIHATNSVLSKDLVQLRDLLHMNIDSRNGFAYAGKLLADKHSSLALRFHRYSQQRNDFVEKIKEIEVANREEPNERGTIAASLHRTWIELKDGLKEEIDVSAVVIEALRGEGFIKQAYETALETIAEPRLHSLLKQQYDSINESHSWLAGLKADNERRKGNAI